MKSLIINGWGSGNVHPFKKRRRFKGVKIVYQFQKIG
jgi:hypothetical protein